MIRIVHSSDLHGRFYKFPEADLYIITGDMYSNAPKHGWERYLPTTKEREELHQSRWVSKHREGFREKFLGSPQAPVVLVRGNHDFIGLAPLFDDGPVYDIGFDCHVYEIDGLKISGCRGVNYIAGEWNDEFRDADLSFMFQQLSGDLDIVATHTPPLGILDSVHGERCGARELRSYINRCQYEDGWRLPKLFCFGHIHREFGILEEGGTIFSNAATKHHVFDLEF